MHTEKIDTWRGDTHRAGKHGGEIVTQGGGHERELHTEEDTHGGDIHTGGDVHTKGTYTWRDRTDYTTYITPRGHPTKGTYKPENVAVMVAMIIPP